MKDGGKKGMRGVRRENQRTEEKNNEGKKTKRKGEGKRKEEGVC